MTMRRLSIAVLALIGGFIAPTPPAAASADILAEASALVQSLDGKANAIVNGKDIDGAERERRFHAMFVGTFDVPAIGRFVLGRYWRTANDAQKAEFLI